MAGALEIIEGQPMASSLRLYHNKLIREGDGQLLEVLDLPSHEMKVWRDIKTAHDSGWIPPSQRRHSAPETTE